MRVLVTGASGYLGRAVVAELHAAGHDVSAFVHRTSFPDASGVELHHGDLLDEDAVAAAVRGVDAVVHLAGLTRVRESVEHPGRFYRLNVGGTATLLEALASAAAVRGSAPRFLLASTAAVYGAPVDQPISEDTPTDPRNPYAATKVAAEQLLTWAANSGQVAVSSLRIFNAAGAVTGHRDTDDTRIIPRVVGAATGAVSHVDVFGDGSAVRDYVHVSDVGRAFVTALESSCPGTHEVFNVGATPSSVADILEAAARVTGKEIPVTHKPANPAESPELRADATRLRARGWEPRSSGLDRLIDDQWNPH